MNSFHVITVETVANCLSEIGSLFGYTFDLRYHTAAVFTVWLYN